MALLKFVYAKPSAKMCNPTNVNSRKIAKQSLKQVILERKTYSYL